MATNCVPTQLEIIVNFSVELTFFFESQLSAANWIDIEQRQIILVWKWQNELLLVFFFFKFNKINLCHIIDTKWWRILYITDNHFISGITQDCVHFKQIGFVALAFAPMLKDKGDKKTSRAKRDSNINKNK